MEKIKVTLDERIQFLLQLKREKEIALKNAPEGHLRISQSGSKVQYYKRINPKDFNGKYLNDGEIQIAGKLAQKDYDRKILRAVEQELKAIQKFMAAYPVKNPEQIYEGLHKERQKLIVPIRETDEEYISRWETVKYQRKEFYNDSPEFYTAKGERVRSKSEVIIADTLGREGIPYRCEYPVYIKGIGIFYPDFMILDVKKRREIIWEHFGKMDELEYVQNFVSKINYYERNGYFLGDNLICTFETYVKPLNPKVVKSIVERVCK